MNISKRPWQGTTLGVLAIINTVVIALFSFFFLFGQSILGGFIFGIGKELASQSADAGMAGAFLSGGMGAFQGLTIMMAVAMIGAAVFQGFIAKGLLKGKRWTVILSILFFGSIFLMALSSLEVVPIVLGLALTALPASIVKHPFYLR